MKRVYIAVVMLILAFSAWSMELLPPMESYWISSGSGYRTDPMGGKEESQLHKGLDLVGPHHTPVKAARTERLLQRPSDIRRADRHRSLERYLYPVRPPVHYLCGRGRSSRGGRDNRQAGKHGNIHRRTPALRGNRQSAALPLGRTEHRAGRNRALAVTAESRADP